MWLSSTKGHPSDEPEFGAHRVLSGLRNGRGGRAIDERSAACVGEVRGGALREGQLGILLRDVVRSLGAVRADNRCRNGGIAGHDTRNGRLDVSRAQRAHNLFYGLERLREAQDIVSVVFEANNLPDTGVSAQHNIGDLRGGDIGARQLSRAASRDGVDDIRERLVGARVKRAKSREPAVYCGNDRGVCWGGNDRRKALWVEARSIGRG